MKKYRIFTNGNNYTIFNMDANKGWNCRAPQLKESFEYLLTRGWATSLEEIPNYTKNDKYLGEFDTFKEYMDAYPEEFV